MKQVVPGTDFAARQAVDWLDAGKRRVAIVGPEGCGKSTALELAGAQIVKKGGRTVSLAFPRTGDDAALVVLAGLAAQLAPYASDLVQTIKDPKLSWDDKLAASVLTLEKSDATLLLDDPAGNAFGSIPSVFALRKHALGSAFQSLARTKMIVAARSSPIGDRVALETRSRPAAILKSPAWTGTLSPAAAALIKIQDDLTRYSPLEVQLAIAAVAQGAAADSIGSRRWAPAELVQRALAGDENVELRSVVGRLALCRTEMDDALLESLGARKLSAPSRIVLENVLLLRTPKGRLLHEMIGGPARKSSWLDAGERQGAHRAIAKWHHGRFVAAAAKTDIVLALRSEIEVIHHLTEAGDADAVLAAAVFFPEQLDALGKALSVAHRYENAVTAYERALDYDVEDAYAHHYLAWNLDVMAQDPDRVLTEYSEARRWQDDHVWYHGRRIAFLVTTGRVDEARDAFGEALAALPADSNVASELHRPVAQLLLHRGQVEFATYVLEDARPHSAATEWFRTLSQLLADLQDASEQRVVFPPEVDEQRRWDGPHLLNDEGDRERVTRWMPGRVTSSDEIGLRVRFADRDATGAVRYAYRDISAGELTGMTGSDLHLPAGTFVELLELAGGKTSLLSWPRGRRKMPGLSPIFPPPDRYIRRAFAGS